jgi:hypothetical protein
MIGRAIRAVIPEKYRPTGYLTRKVYDGTGGNVHAGPFKGMRYISSAFYSCYIPKLLGIYERELYGAVEESIRLSPDLIIDVGAAEGYYAVGLAIRCPSSRVVAYEMDPRGQSLLAEMCRANSQEKHVEIRGRCDRNELQSTLQSADHPLAVVDCEGYEIILLDPRRVPGLLKTTILVELHDFILPGIAEELTERFSPTHQVDRIWQTERSNSDFPFDSAYVRLLQRSHVPWAVSEWRPCRMSWLWMRPHALVQNQ